MDLRAHALLSAAAAAALTLPFLLALPSHYEPESWEWGAALWLLAAAIGAAAWFAARRVMRLPHGARMVAAFAALYLALAILGCMSIDRYRLVHATTELALLYLVFFVATALGALAPLSARVVLAALVLGLAGATIVHAVHVHTFGFPIGPDGYRAILQTNPGEAFEFVGRFVGTGALAATVAALAVALAAAFGALPLRLSREGFGWAGTYALAAFAIVALNAELVTPRARGFSEAVDYVAEVGEYQAVRASRRARGPAVAVSREGALARAPNTTLVFVVGESLTRNHMSLYGYWRDTTPALQRLAPEMAVFTDAVSPHSHTDQSLELVLTLANQDNRLGFSDPQNHGLIELLRAAGFSTWWISNQSAFGPWDNKTAVLARAADRVRYTGSRSGTLLAGPHDEALLEPFAAALRDPAPHKAIFLHFLGNHWEYAKRFPPEAAAFSVLPTPAEVGALNHARPRLINDYDNAVRYHDGLVARAVEMLRATNAPAALVLFSDHGESVYEMKEHYWKQFTRHHVEVPLALWFSPQYASLAGDAVARARANARLPFALENLTHLAADLAGLRSEVFDPRRSPLNAAYAAPRERRLFEGLMVYERGDDPILNTRQALDQLAAADPALRPKLWAHRVDTLGKMMEAARLFAGVEIDVAYDPAAKALVVHHPPEPAPGLTLERLLGYAQRLNPGLALWLDIKNLNEANGARVLEELQRLDKAYGLRARALVETDHTGPAAAALRSAGYRTSYYLPNRVVLQEAQAGASASCYGAAEIQAAVAAQRFTAVSYDWRGRGWVQRCLGSFVRSRGLASYAWDLEKDLSAREALKGAEAERARAYGTMAGILLPFRSLFDDWR